MRVWTALRRQSFGMWPPARRRSGVLAITMAVVTAAGVVAWSGDEASRMGPGLYVALAGLALVFPPAITLQVVAGQILTWTVIAGATGMAAVARGVPLLVAVIVTAELLAVVTRLDTVLVPRSSGTFTGIPEAAIRGGAVFVVVALVATLPGPGGLPSVILASMACAGLAMLLLRTSR